MKKFIAGFIAGALLFGGTAAIAAQPGLIGQKVQSVFSVEKDGKKIADAVAIGGATYAPVRALAEATGTDIKIEGKTITMSDKELAPVSVDDEIPLNVQIMVKQNKLGDAKRALEAAERGKQGWEDMLAQLDPDTEYGKAIAKNIADAEKRVTDAQAKVEQIEAELAALQAKQ